MALQASFNIDLIQKLEIQANRNTTMILIIVDAHSKYIDAHVVSAATTSATLTKLRQTFAILGGAKYGSIG